MEFLEAFKACADKGYLISVLSDKETGAHKIVELSGDHPNITIEVVIEYMNKYDADELVYIHNERLISDREKHIPILS
jgi:hypothetical protein